MQACALGPRRNRLLWWVTFTQVLVALYLGWFSSLAGPPELVVAGLCLTLGSFLAGGYLWRDSPLVEGRSVMARVRFAAIHERHLRRTHREVDAVIDRSPPSRSRTAAAP